ncbi:MAG: nitroreductase family protein, partial [Nitrososphaerota archaeon]
FFMDVFSAIKGRRSIRKYAPTPVARELIEKVVDAGRWAPSSGNTQPVEVVVVTDPEKRAIMADVSGYAKYLKEAPVALVVCINLSRARSRYGELGVTYFAPLDAAVAIQNMMLAAYSLGLGTCWDSVFDKNKVRELIELPENLEPFAIIALGYPSENPNPPPRRPLKEILHWEKYGNQPTD